MDLVGWNQAVFAYTGLANLDWASNNPVEAHPPKSLWQDERIIPAYLAALSLVSLTVQGIIHSSRVKKLWSKEETPQPPVINSDAPETVWGRVKQFMERTGSPTIFAFKFVRLGLIEALFALILAGAVKTSSWTWYSYVSVATLAYATFVAVLNLLAPAAKGRTYSFHLSVITFAVFAVYAYRDVWPLTTFTLRPVDEAEGPILWVKVALATLVGVVEPLFEPYPYIPVDPENPSTPSHEQTASLFSFLTYAFLDPVIFKAYRVEHLPHDDFPPLCDYDSTSHLIKKSYSRLDPFSGGKKGHLFFGLLRIFWKPLLQQTFILFILGFSLIAGPVGTNRLLNYLETGGHDAFVRPWVWILVIVLAPISFTVFFQLYIFLSTGSLVRAESVIMSLVFDHALRIRLKAEAAERKDSAAASAAASVAGSDTKGSNTPESGSTHEGDDTDTVHSRTVTATSSATAATSSTATVVAPAASSKPADDKKAAAKPKDGEKEKKNKKNLMGKINNLVTSDLENITDGRDFLFLVVSAPLHIALGMWFLYVVLGWSSFVGLGVMILLVPLPAQVASLTRGVSKKKMEATDSRVQNVTEMMSVLRMIKLFGWESRVTTAVAEKREEELNWIWKRKVLGLTNNIINHTVPIVHMFVTYATFTLVQKQPLSASIVFSSMVAFNMIRSQMFRIFGMLPMFIQANVSLGRVADFLYNTELLDEFSDPPSAEELIVDSSAAHKEDIGFGKTSFSWSNDVPDGTLTPSRQAFRLHIDDEVIFKRGGFNLIVGPTGSGKTSILMALLGEMHYIPSGPESWKNLPREGGVAYAAQESWVQNETIKENIVFGSPYDEERYKKVIYQCALTRDLGLFEAGDATEVGEKGITLSGGQKARITLARAIYSKAQIVLLDDVLAALDVHTSRWIIDKCFKGDLLRDRTVLLVTHNVAMAGPLADFVISLNTDGHIISQGSISEALAKDSKLSEEIKHEEEAVELDETEDIATEAKPADDKKGKLVVAEEIAVGHVSWGAFKLFLQGLGGRWPILFWLEYLSGHFGSEVFDVMETWWLGYWALQYALKNPEDVAIGFYMGIYGLLVTAVVLCHILAELIYTIGSLRASRKIHASLVKSLLGSTFRWLDITPTSRVITRCTQDIQAVDSQVASEMNYLVQVTVSAVVKLAAVVIYTPTFLLPGSVVAGLGLWLGNVYIRAQLSVKREMSNAKSPVLGILGGAIGGLTSIRAYNAQEAFRKETLHRVDRYVRSARIFYNLNRWIGIRIDGLAAVFSAGLAFYLVYGPHTYSPSSVGFVLTMAVSFSELILWWVRIYNQFEVSGNSLERIQQYVTIEQEPEPKEGGTPPAYWPSSGSLEVENLTARYSEDGPKVLENVSFSIKAGERVGIVGRTGSGKSTLTLSLLRCIPTEGTVIFDGIPTHTLNLDALRSNVTIIPQVPELLSGSLRHNLDIFDQYDDATLNDALRAAGLFSLQRLSDENRMTLDTEIASGGGNLSVGQRQIIALARAIVRQSKLLVLDEATSAIDYETDAVIQESLRNELKKDVTVITVAHRLQTIMDSDKVMVLDAGHLVEFDSPIVLLQKEGSLLRALVDESSDKEALYAMAEGKGKASSS